MTKHEEREHFSIYGKTKPEFNTVSSLRINNYVFNQIAQNAFGVLGHLSFIC